MKRYLLLILLAAAVLGAKGQLHVVEVLPDSVEILADETDGPWGKSSTLLQYNYPKRAFQLVITKPGCKTPLYLNLGATDAQALESIHALLKVVENNKVNTEYRINGNCSVYLCEQVPYMNLKFVSKEVYYLDVQHITDCEEGLFEIGDKIYNQYKEYEKEMINSGMVKYGSGRCGSNSWTLNGRSIIGALPKAADNCSNEAGTVVVAIRVDADGKVVSATRGQGTNTASDCLLQAAIKAAKSAQFTPGEGNVVGSITYVFKLK